VERLIMHTAPRQHDIESLLDSLLDRGDKTALAALLDTSLSNISQQINPDEPLKSYVYQGLRFMWGVYAVNPQAARCLWAETARLVSLWEGKRPVQGGDLRSVHHELAEVIDAALTNRSPAQQKKEIHEAISALNARLSLLDREEAA
jgi:hypothetical protein